MTGEAHAWSTAEVSASMQWALEPVPVPKSIQIRTNPARSSHSIIAGIDRHSCLCREILTLPTSLLKSWCPRFKSGSRHRDDEAEDRS